jgi:hypothetical protein
MAEFANCLQGCVGEDFCSPLHKCGPGADIIAPWVSIKMEGLELITVGNGSSGGNCRAVIKSFELGYIDTQQVVVEVLDEEGGKFGALIDRIQKCISVRIGSVMNCQWGWVMSNCDSEMPPMKSTVVKCILKQIEINYSEGKIKYKLYGTALDPLFFNMREDKTLGTDDKTMNIEDAIELLCSQEPHIRVSYCEKQNGKIECKGKGTFDWYKFGKGGPKATWQADNENRISTISKWIEPFRVNNGTDQGLGIILMLDSTEYDHLMLVLDPMVESSSDCDNSLGTFIVNGGKCSPVLEFTPKFNWVSGWGGLSVGGETAGPLDSSPVFSEDARKEDACCTHTGIQQQFTVTQQAVTAYGPKDAHPETVKSVEAHQRANRLVSVTIEPITAELRIIGDPSDKFVRQSLFMGKNVSIVAINPFHLRGNECPEWIAEPECNQILSSKKWMCMGTNHSIKEGSYTTTLKLVLYEGTIGVTCK